MFHLSVRIFEGRNFPVSDVLNEAEETSYYCKGVVGKRASQTDDVPRVRRHQALWGGAELKWDISAAELRDLQSTHGHFKVTCFQRRGAAVPLALGWVVLELRDAKLNAATNAAPQWMPLMGSGKPGTSPAEIRLSYYLHENGHRGAMPAEGGEAVNSRDEEDAANVPPATEPPERSLGTAPAPRDDGPLMRFKLHVDVRSFHAGGHMPTQVASVAVTVRLPPELAEATPGGGSAVTAPIRSHPPIQVQRNSEEAILNGYASLELPMSERAMEAMLAKNPRILAEISTVEKFSKDQVMGLASIPMAPLLREPAIDGYAPVLAARPGGKKVEVGGLRLFLALENLGPLTPGQGLPHSDTSVLDLAHAARQHEEAVRRLVASAKDTGEPSTADADASTTDLSEPPGSIRGQDLAGSGAVEAEGYGHVTDVAASFADTSGLRGGVLGMDDTGASSQPSFNVWAAAVGLDGDPAGNGSGEGGALGVLAVPSGSRGPLLHGTPEYEAAYEIELWKRAEKVRWLAELKTKEEARMRILENEWRAQEQKRRAALMEVQEEAASQREKVKLLLAVVEERERKVVAAEEAVLLKKQQLEREYAQATQEAQSVMRRMQEDCEHLVEIERNRYADMERHCALLEKRLRTANARVEDLENKFHQYKQQHGSTSEAQLMLEVAHLQKDKAEAVRKAESAQRAKQHLRSQLVRLARELASLKWQRDKEAALLKLARGAQADGIRSLASLVRAHDEKETEFLGDVLNVKSELESLKLQRKEEDTAAAAAARMLASDPLPYGGKATSDKHTPYDSRSTLTTGYSKGDTVPFSYSKGSGGAPLLFRPCGQPAADDPLEYARNVPHQVTFQTPADRGPSEGPTTSSSTHAPSMPSSSNRSRGPHPDLGPMLSKDMPVRERSAFAADASRYAARGSAFAVVPGASGAAARRSQLPTAWMNKENLSHLVHGLDLKPEWVDDGGMMGMGSSRPGTSGAYTGYSERTGQASGRNMGEGNDVSAKNSRDDDEQPRGGRRISAEAEVARLHRERAALLRTGAYQPGDALVVELDRRIAVLSTGGP